MFAGVFLCFLLAGCQSTSHSDSDNKPADSPKDGPPKASPPISFNRGLSDVGSSRKCDLRAGSAVVLMYHKFDEPHKSTSVTIPQFEEQLQFFKNNGYQVVPLNKIVSAVKGQIPFGKKWIAITIDDAYKSFLKAKPLLESYQYPYTIFVNSQAVDEGYSSSMSWEDLKGIMQSGLGELAAHSHTHGHLVQDMNTQQRQKDILLSVEQIYQNTSFLPQFFSYPFGEVSHNLMQEVKSMNQVSGRSFRFSAAFSTQSGPVGCSSDLFALPRFAINEKYGVVDDLFKIKMNSRHLPVVDYHPKNPAVCVEEQINKVYFSVSPNVDLSDIKCYANRGNTAHVNVSPDGLVTISLGKALGFGLNNPEDIRERLNCTAYYKGRYFWYGREFTILKNSPDCSKYTK